MQGQRTGRIVQVDTIDISLTEEKAVGQVDSRAYLLSISPIIFIYSSRIPSLFQRSHTIMASVIVPPRTPSPKVRIRSQSFDSPSSRISVTPIDESPFSKSTGAIVARAVSLHHALEPSDQDGHRPARVLLPLHTKMSDESMTSDASSASSSEASSLTNSEQDMELMSDSPSLVSQYGRQRPHPLTFCQSVTYEATPTEEQPSSPFLYQDTNYPMYSPWLVRVVLDLNDVRGLDWMSIAEPVQHLWGVRTSTAEVLNILSDNGRVLNRQWWD
jgi:hypothetical protein